ncbi:MAG: DNA-binding protein [Anaerolineae bacterium CG_4_9_14_0_8_um_filter_58_9]|nr:MAG: DNA-binding protein [Anaerolineae bacterium CG_4_9_14_0_8_um_filter_58_9]
MSDETFDKQGLIAYRLERAGETLQDAELLFEQGGTPASVVNRAYYAMFYTVLALLITVGAGSSKHSGAIALFDEHFVRSGKFSKEMSKTLHRAFDLRQIGDYRELLTLDDTQAEEILGAAKVFVHTVEQFLTG